ncbi:hypothetical protein N3K66_005230 [Trichothecium roseum]|uniref:Uncharacterized protein n=1 Tax=Trichothecium roseum TaxID=47278 RepID=A0ACC0V3F6_9HYPO|nr:hypothetical protein N3K66_005230 [Trichothecium roseum]
MNGFEKDSLREEDFGAKGSIVSAFDAFPKAKPQYVTRTSGGGKWTVVMAVFSFIFVWAEASRWWNGHEERNFAVEKGVSHEMQVNLDMVIKMKCSDLHVNVQDAAGDRILASTKLRRDPTNWSDWVDQQGVHKLGRDAEGRVVTGAGWKNLVQHEDGFGEEHVHDIVRMGKKRAKWGKTPKVKGASDSCRLYGSLDLNKVQGDFHITARGHGYREFGAQHLDHARFNFSHVVSELSYGTFYPSLVNPLDNTVNTAETNFHKFQYYISVVPTAYSHGRSTMLTNQYAVTEQSKQINEHYVPGIFFKYDIEPIMLSVKESRASILAFMLRIINVVSGVLVAGHWGYTLSEWARDVLGVKKRRSGGGSGVLGSKDGYDA